MDHRQLARALAYGRITLGAALVVAPGTAGRPWIGEVARQPAVKVFSRALGVRDLALGVGALEALDGDAPVRPWVTMAMISDLVDLVATGLAIRSLGARRALPVMIVAAAGAAAGYAARDQVD